MALERLFWDEDKFRFVKFKNKNKLVNPQPVGFPTSFFTANKERDGTADDEIIEEHAPMGANAYCSGNLRLPSFSSVSQRVSFEVQYYII